MALSTGIEQMGHEAEHSLLCSAEVKNSGATPHSPVCLHGMTLDYLSPGSSLLFMLPIPGMMFSQRYFKYRKDFSVL